MSLFRFIFIFLFIIPIPSLAQLLPDGPDLIPEFGSHHSIDNGTLSFDLIIRNQGAPMESEKTLFSKILLVPRKDFPTQLVSTGLVLSTFSRQLQLGENESLTTRVETSLPNIDKDDYFLAVTINTTINWGPTDMIGPVAIDDSLSPGEDDSNITPLDDLERPSFVAEPLSAQQNNITKHMIFLGELAHETTPHPDGPYDLYHEVSSAHFDIQSNMASHSSRNILRVMDGNDEIPDSEFWDNDISARFCFFDLKAGTAYLGQYNSMALDKVWGAIHWQPEMDFQGRPIYVDYYSNLPMVEHLPPAEYVLGVLLNVNDKFQLDSYPENNLDLTFLDLSEKEALSTPDAVWYDVNNLGEAFLQSNIAGRSDQHIWSYEIDAPDWLDIIETNDNYSYTLLIEASPDMPIGAFEIPVTIKAIDSGGVEQSKVSVLRIHKSDGPSIEFIGLAQGEVININHPNLTIEENGHFKTLHFSFKIINKGNRDLIFDKGSLWPVNLELELPQDRVLEPGEEATLMTHLKLIGVPIPRPDVSSHFSVSLNLQSNAPHRYINFSFDLKGIVIDETTD